MILGLVRVEIAEQRRSELGEGACVNKKGWGVTVLGSDVSLLRTRGVNGQMDWNIKCRAFS